MKKNDLPKNGLFDIVMQNSNVKQKEEPTPQSDSKTSPFFILGLILGFFFNSFLIYLGLEVLENRISNFPSFSYIDSVLLYMAGWAVSGLVKKK